MYAPAGLRDKRSDLSFDEILGEVAPAAWSGVFEQDVLRGAPAFEEVVLFHQPTGALLAADLFMNVHETRGPVSRLVYRVEGCWRRPRIPRLIRWLTRDERSFAHKR